MTVRLTTKACGQSWIVRVDGWLEGADSDELLRVVQSMSGQVQLDLSDLRSADGRGLQTIQRLAGEGATVGQIGGYLRFLLASDTPDGGKPRNSTPGKAGEEPCDQNPED